MKKRLLPLALVSVLAFTVTGCAKERQCKCTIDDNVTLHEPVFIVDGGMKCSDIKEIAIEVKYTAEDGTHTLQRTEVHNVSCREQAR